MPTFRVLAFAACKYKIQYIHIYRSKPNLLYENVYMCMNISHKTKKNIKKWKIVKKDKSKVHYHHIKCI